MSRHRTESASGERGAAAVVVVVLLSVFLGAAALTVDIGLGYAAKRQLSVAADAAAVAAAKAASSALPPGSGANCGEYLEAMSASAEAAAVNYTEANGAPTTNSGFSVDVLCPGGAENPEDVRVTVRNQATVPTVFGDSLGFAALQPPGAAVARVFVPNAVADGLRPFAACDAFVLQGLANNKPFVVAIDKSEAICGSAEPGEWGYVDFTNQGDFISIDPNCVPSGQSTKCTEIWTETGYEGPVFFPNLVDATPGGGLGQDTGFAYNPLEDELKSIIGQTILLPIADGYDKPSKAMDLFGVVQVEVCGVIAGGSKVGSPKFQYPEDAASTPSACSESSSQPEASDIGFDNWLVEGNEGALWVMPVSEDRTGPVVGGPGDFDDDRGLRVVQLYR